MTRLNGQHALITGGGTGIGAAIARALAAEGARLTLVGRRKEPLVKTAQDIRSLGTSVEIEICTADVTDRAQVNMAFGLAREAHGPVTILVNNAGAAESVPFSRITEAGWRRIMAVNLDALLHCCQAALPDLVASGSGRIVTVSSLAGLHGFAYAAHYAAAKHGAVGLMRSLAIELAGTGVTANAICPGFTETDIVADAVANLRDKTGRSEDEARAALAGLNPGGRLLTPDEVAAVLLRLCLPESASVTGQAIEIPGGDAQ